MILGFALAFFVSLALVSLIIIATSVTGALKENLVTGAVIGTSGAVSYALIVFVIALVAAVFIALLMKPVKAPTEPYYAKI